MAPRKQESRAEEPRPERGETDARRAEIAEAATARLLALLRTSKSDYESTESACKIGHMLKELGLL